MIYILEQTLNVKLNFFNSLKIRNLKCSAQRDEILPLQKILRLTEKFIHSNPYFYRNYYFKTINCFICLIHKIWNISILIVAHKLILIVIYYYYAPRRCRFYFLYYQKTKIFTQFFRLSACVKTKLKKKRIK